jgi:hypothetical protein
MATSIRTVAEITAKAAVLDVACSGKGGAVVPSGGEITRY